jgi:hypothetical protein
MLMVAPRNRTNELTPGFIVIIKKRSVIQPFFSTTTYAAIAYFGTL